MESITSNATMKNAMRAVVQKALEEPLSEENQLAMDEQIERLENCYYVPDERGAAVKFVLQNVHRDALKLTYLEHFKQVAVTSGDTSFRTFCILFAIDKCILDGYIHAAIKNFTDKDFRETFQETVQFIKNNSEYVQKNVDKEESGEKILAFTNRSYLIGEKPDYRDGATRFNLFPNVFATASTSDEFHDLLARILNGSQYHPTFFEGKPDGSENRFTEVLKNACKHAEEGRLTKEGYCIHFID